MKIRKANTRGHFENNWLNSWHTFSFSSYYDPTFMGFSALRVINDDKIKPFQGFGVHPHKDMEIVTFMLKGELTHQDSLGNKHILKEGNVQLMRAGSGITHSEVNLHPTVSHLLQIWILPKEKNLTPGWWEKQFNVNSSIQCIVEPISSNKDKSLINTEITEEGLKIAQNAYILSISKNSLLDMKKFVTSDIYIHVFEGEVEINNEVLYEGDAVYQEKYNDNIIINANSGKCLVFIFPN